MMLIRTAVTGCLLVAMLALSACAGGSGGAQESPEKVLASAKATLDKTSGVQVSLSTPKLPPTVDGILQAKGVGTHDPAFKGDLKVATSGVTADVPVVAAQGKVLAQLPFTTKFVEVDPSEYAAPDPAGLMEPEGGLSSLLTAAQDVEEGKQVRSGEDVLSSYTGTVPGKVVADIIPSASATGSFDARFTVDDQDRLREAVLTGPFYPKAGDVTYTITFDRYDTDAHITLP
jgi:lipoprotein LprG